MRAKPKKRLFSCSKMAKKQQHILLTWDARNTGFVVTADTVRMLNERIAEEAKAKPGAEVPTLGKVIYLLHDKLSHQNQLELDVFLGKKRFSDASKEAEKQSEEGSEKAIASEERVKRLRQCREIAERVLPVPKIEMRLLSIDRVVDYESIFSKVSEFLKQNLYNLENTILHINISPGTPQMQVVWLMLNSMGYLPSYTRLWSGQWVREERKSQLFPIAFKPREYLGVLLDKKNKELAPALDTSQTLSPARREAEGLIKLFLSVPGVPMLVLGERGTGKSTYLRQFANSLANKREGKPLPYEELACGLFSQELLRSELFGHTRGSFTGADADKEGILGKFKDGGILFLDEIQDLSKPLQRMLLQVLQTRKYRPIGGSNDLACDFRLVSASNLRQEELLARLDLDFYDRVASMVVEVPPLRQCRDDLRRYWKDVWERISEESPLDIWSEELEDFLKNDELRGNFRDLQKLAAYVHAFYHESKGSREAIEKALSYYRRFDSASAETSDAHGLFQRGLTHTEMVAEYELRMVEWAIREYGGKAQASEALGRSIDMLNKYLRGSRLRNRDKGLSG